ncbi:MAG: N-terminal phage integrase SAM-like domain-containing protein, partial [Actinomycetota bacterium]|nr:N-terminal phage integrase SAM-like domain-containing protein [Actinomycetota bacterium]
TDRVTLREWHARWWSTIENSDRAANTLVQYEGILRLHVLSHLGDRPMASLRRIDVEEWLATLRADKLGQSGYARLERCSG